MKDFDIRAREVNAKGNPRAKWFDGVRGWSELDKKGEFPRADGEEESEREREREREGGRKEETSSLERILSYTIQVQVPSRTRHRKALKSPLKMTASLLGLAAKGIRGSTSGVEGGDGD